MAKKKRPGLLDRLAGKKVVFNGKFGYGSEDSLKAIAQAQQGTVLDDLDAKTDYLILADASAGKTIQKKAAALTAKGAAIQVIDADAFKKLAEPTDEEIIALLRGGASDLYSKIYGMSYVYARVQTPTRIFHGEDLSGATVKSAVLVDTQFCDCNFVGAELDHVHIGSVADCDFSKVKGDSVHFGDVPRSRFVKCVLNEARFEGDFSNADFSGAALEGALFSTARYLWHGQTKCSQPAAVRFTKTKLISARFHDVHLKAPDFSGADLTKAALVNCVVENGNFTSATLKGALLVGCNLAGANLCNTDLTEANLGGADLTGANLTGANMKNTNLRGATLDGANLSKVKNYDSVATASGSIGPALKELDTLTSKADRIQVKFRLQSSDNDDGDEVGIDTSHFKYGYGINVPIPGVLRQSFPGGKLKAFSDAMLQMANLSGHRQVRFETVDVSSTKSPKGGKELRDLVMRGIAEAFAQEMPPEAELAEATKKYRGGIREKGAAEREERKRLAVEAAKQKEKAKKQIARKIKKAVGTVSDVASFLKALEVRIEKPKIDKATKMLKASGFKLFSDVTDEHVSGVVKSQTDPDLVYACRVAHDGQYSCCTQNLNVCGGLRGSICKHMLVLIIGLVQAGELDPTTIDEWIAKTHSTKPELDKEAMGAIFIKYKGAEAGEVDWRPTETVPEDYYAL